MNNVQHLIYQPGSKEELLPDFQSDFPYIASRAELDNYMGRCVPWHWHKPVELFYMESGSLEYSTPGGKILFPAGSGGMVNSNVLHMTRPMSKTEENRQVLHIFDPSFLAGEPGSRIGKKYITPLVAAPRLELIPLFPDVPAHREILGRIVEAFQIPSGGWGYEIKLRAALSEIWLMLFELSRPMQGGDAGSGRPSDHIKLMMIYIHEHYPEKIPIRELAAAGYLSERECFRAFRDCLHMTPTDYIRSYRLQMACQMLARGQQPITAVGHACGLGSSSYFGKVFREYAQCTPMEYRRKWQDSDIKRQE